MSTRGGYIQAGQFYPIDDYAQWVFDDPATDFVIASTGAGWVLTQASSGTAVLTDRAGGWIQMDAGATTADQGVQLQKAGEFVLPAANKNIMLQAYVDFSANIANQFFFGVCTYDTSIFAAGENSTANNIGFEMNATSIAASPGYLQLVSEKATVRTTVADAYLVTVDTPILLQIVVTGVSTIQFYVDGTLVGTISTNIPVSEMAPAILCQAEGTTRPTLDFAFLRGKGDR